MHFSPKLHLELKTIITVPHDGLAASFWRRKKSSFDPGTLRI
jgi:hypothetical protein